MPDPTETREQIREHIDEYGYQIPALRDPQQRLVKYCGTSRTPEAAVFSAQGALLYRGRIDDRFTDYGKSREFAVQHDLNNAVEAVSAGKLLELRTTAVIGCPIPEIDE